MNAVLDRPEQQVSVAPLMALISLPRTRPTVAAARAWLRDTLTAWGIVGVQRDDAVTALSEAFTNSVVHAAGEGNATVTAASWQGSLRITVADPDPTVPKRRFAGAGDESGRGMEVLRALVLRHGTTRTSGGGKVVWFEQLLTRPGAVMTGTCLECGHTSGCDCDCCPYQLPAVTAAQQVGGEL
jgi:anti-sigma regulatory factor (Ser/Thr protein kinase)